MDILNTIGQASTLLAVAILGSGAPATVPVDTPTNDQNTIALEQQIEFYPTEFGVPTVQHALRNVCQSRGYGQTCAKDLFGMLWVESNNVSTAIGDQGRARGYFQIHYRLHHISTGCAEDIVCSANWTIDYLEQNNYPEQRDHAIQCHNGCYANNGYVAKTKRATANLWNDPMEIKQVKPVSFITLASL